MLGADTMLWVRLPVSISGQGTSRLGGVLNQHPTPQTLKTRRRTRHTNHADLLQLESSSVTIACAVLPGTL